MRPDVVTDGTHSRFREITVARAAEFLANGVKLSLVFPHRVYYLPKGGPDAFKLADRMLGAWEPGEVWEIVLYGEGPRVDEFPKELFFDDDIVWHQQHLGRPGHIATANLVLKGRELYTNAHNSDLVQRISRRREHKTRVEKLFKGWAEMLLNAILNFALENRIETVYTPSADVALENTDRRRNPQRELFDRIYDRTVHRQFRATRAGAWWALSVAENRERVVVPQAGAETVRSAKTICLCHDVERGLGHLESDPAFASLADRVSRDHLDAMLATEAKLGVTATYSVVGTFLDEVREMIGRAGHALAFHSFDHRIEGNQLDQLSRCRRIDYRLKGYRLPQSRSNAETTDRNLLYHNFEWLASSVRSLGLEAPALVNRLVRVPIRFDDYALYREGVAYERWERWALDQIAKHDFVAFGMHDCYAQFWLPRYEQFLRRVRELGELTTIDTVAAEVTLRHAV